MIMAGGTGGHIYPALAVGLEFRQRGMDVSWLGAPGSMEAAIAVRAGFAFDAIRIRGLWNRGAVRWLSAPLWLSAAVVQSIAAIVRRRPDVLLGMGGYVCGPGGLAAALLRRPLVIHESNAIPGLTNRVLAILAARVLTGFSNVALRGQPIATGTPVRFEIIEASERQRPASSASDCPLHLLIIGGSQGAQSLNAVLPAIVADIDVRRRPVVWHQSGRGRHEALEQAYRDCGVSAQVFEFIDDMAAAYAWADVVIARAGAMTLAELAVMGKAVIAVPYPYAARDHQRINAESLAREARLRVCLDDAQLAVSMDAELQRLIDDRAAVGALSRRIRSAAQPRATDAVVEQCLQVMQ